MSDGVKSVDAQLMNADQAKTARWVLAEEQPIAIRISGETYAIMLATPLDLLDFTRGFCLSEGLVKSANAIQSISQKPIRDGIEVNVILTDEAFDRFHIIDRRRRLAGASGCGVCGLTSLSHIVEDLPKIDADIKIPTASLIKASKNLREYTPLNRQSFSVHAAAFANHNGDILLVREDVGRHNALDKLFGALSQQDIELNSGFILFTSRFAYEMAQKCIRMGAPIIASISAPTTMAVDMAIKANMTFAAFADHDELMVFSGADRLI
ncbi:MAG: formate dehydrogenase accessory sulfurtransferase FdhD [OCS116 cluster bacterium]|nr:formate dehydrogenase accessory sulfurtransferase FdhD [OCS116 cluster bacterium]